MLRIAWPIILQQFTFAALNMLGVPLAALGAFYFQLPVHLVYLCAMSEEVTKWLLGVLRWRSRRWINNLAGSA
jgi:Na+-driven multidrug efflux pump